MSVTWEGKYSKWAEHIECGQDGCTEISDLMGDEGGGYCTYYCPIHGPFGVQYDDPDEDYDPDLDFGDWDDPYDDDGESVP